MSDRKKIRGTKKLMIGFAREEIKWEIKEGEAKKGKENGKRSAHIFWLMYYFFYLFLL